MDIIKKKEKICEDVTCGEGMTGDGDDSWHGKREKFGGNGVEEIVVEDHASCCFVPS